MASLPTHNVVIFRRAPAGSGGKPVFTQVEAAWLNEEKDQFIIELSDGVVLDWRMRETHRINLFPSGGRSVSPGEPRHGIPTTREFPSDFGACV